MRNRETEGLSDFPKIAQVISGEILTLHLALLGSSASNKSGLKEKVIMVWGLQGTENKIEVEKLKKRKKIFPPLKNYFSMQNRKKMLA